MAIEIIITAGGATANSYASIEAADLYFLGRSFADAWTDADADTKARALVSATRRLDQESWRGTPTATTQGLLWPRYGVENPDYQNGSQPSGYYSTTRLLASDAIPGWLERATCELALVLLSNNLLEDTGLEGLESVGVGDLQVTPRKGRAGRLPANVWRECRPYLLGAGGKVDLVRS